MDELLNILSTQIKQERVELLSEQRLRAYKFLNNAYRYVQNCECVAEVFDAWEFKILFGFNHLTGLSRKSNRDDLLKQIAETRWIVDMRIQSNPLLTEGERKLFEMVESFKVTV